MAAMGKKKQDRDKVREEMVEYRIRDKDTNPVISLFEEDFEMKKREDYYIITHPKWSLTGLGDSIDDAIRDLIDEARGIYELIVESPEDELSEQSAKLKEFLLRVGKN